MKPDFTSTDDFLCDLCHLDSEELNQRCDIPIQGNLDRCAWICDECLKEWETL